MELRPQVMIWELVLLQSECGMGGGPESSGVCVLGKAASLSLSAEEWGAPTAGKGLGLGWGCSGWQLTRIRGPQDPGGARFYVKSPPELPLKRIALPREPEGQEGQGGASHWGPSPTPLFQKTPQVCTCSCGQKRSGLGDIGGLGMVGLAGSVLVTPLAPEPASWAGLLTRHIPPGPGRSAHLWSRNLPVGCGQSSTPALDLCPSGRLGGSGPENWMWGRLPSRLRSLEGGVAGSLAGACTSLDTNVQKPPKQP